MFLGWCMHIHMQQLSFGTVEGTVVAIYCHLYSYLMDDSYLLIQMLENNGKWYPKCTLLSFFSKPKLHCLGS